MGLGRADSFVTFGEQELDLAFREWRGAIPLIFLFDRVLYVLGWIAPDPFVPLGMVEKHLERQQVRAAGNCIEDTTVLSWFYPAQAKVLEELNINLREQSNPT